MITRSPFFGGLEAMRNSEVSYAVKAIMSNPVNESPWRYLKGLYKGYADLLVNEPRVSTLCMEVLEKYPNNVFALSLLLDLFCYGLQPGEGVTSMVETLVQRELGTSVVEPGTPDKLSYLICTLLEKFDPMRVNYWIWRKNFISPEAITR